MKITERDLAIEHCKEEFFRSLKLACSAAGGAPIFTANTTLDEIANRLAQNGIRFTYDKRGVCSEISDSIILKKAMQKLNDIL
jgi:hypothetical protein